jgi:hypothetical protein
MRARISLVACILLAACVTIPTATRPGMGVVESVHRSPGEGIAPYGSYPTGNLVTVRMADGSVQRVSSISAAFRQGDRVEITPEGKIVTLP